MRFLKTASSLALCTVLATGMAVAQQHDDHSNNFHFRDQDRNQFRQHYQADTKRYQNNQHGNRAHYSSGQHLTRQDVGHFKPVPSSYHRGLPAAPRGYRYGYYDGNVVVYNPVTMLVADALDLIGQ